ncbi:MAG: tetratricopeptide repeat protein [Thermodesulfobacteriota bacterium]|nr:tetratricopeptide repeat protein [Thermodesulfobacteriota bacterium]
MDRIPTKTLAEIYLRQGHLREAYEIYQALSGKDPSDPEIQKRLNELSKILSLSHPSSLPFPRSKEEKIRYLERWLIHIRERKKG